MGKRARSEGPAGARKSRKTLTKRVNKLTRIVGKPEIKTHTTSFSDGDVNKAGVFFKLMEIPQGDGAVNRDGNKVRVVGAQWSYKLNSQGSTNQASLCRVGIICDRATDGTLPVQADIQTTVNDPLSLKTFTSRHGGKRFWWLHDKKCVINATTNIDTRWVHGFKKLNLTVNWAAGTTGNPTKNPIYAYVQSDAVAASSDVQSEGFFRIFFVEN